MTSHVWVYMLTAGTDARDVLPEALAVGFGVAAVLTGAMLLTWRSAPKVRPIP